ncbi:MAG: DUF6152 family protein [Gammaproteobacteria bacterium]|nr:DUF6152 family protein [Gammaproteobacteria bacterium]
MKTLFLNLAGAFLLLVATPAAPHHAFASEFDINKPVSLTGPVTRMEWTNPHAWLFLETEDDDGNLQSWSVELVGINDLMRLGWGRDRVKVGEVISVQGYGARNGTNTANAASVALTESGEVLWESVARSGSEGRDRSRTPL